MSHRGLENNQLLELIPDDLNNYEILDLGAGYGFWGWAIRTHKTGTPQITGIDIVPDCIEKLHTLGIYDEVIQHDLTRGIPFPDKSFDITIASHIIEHLTKDKGFTLINEIERVSRAQVIISCPRGKTRSNINDLNPKIHHRSEWFETDFNKLGYQIQIIRWNLGKVPDLVFSWHQKIRGRLPPYSVILAHKIMDSCLD